MEALQSSKIILNDYTLKIKGKIPANSNLTSSDINEFIALFNYCFHQKNNFFVQNFNKKVIKNILVCYNQIKTNILSNEITDIFANLEIDNIKLLRFILINFINNFETINTLDNSELCDVISKDSMKRCLHYLNNIIK
jgi:hypothetical protein